MNLPYTKFLKSSLGFLLLAALLSNFIAPLFHVHQHSADEQRTHSCTESHQNSHPHSHQSNVNIPDRFTEKTHKVQNSSLIAEDCFLCLTIQNLQPMGVKDSLHIDHKITLSFQVLRWKNEEFIATSPLLFYKARDGPNLI